LQVSWIGAAGLYCGPWNWFLVIPHFMIRPAEVLSRFNYTIRDNPFMVRVEVYEGQKKIAEVGLPEKKFSTGSLGYWASDKLEMNGKRYQCQFQMVEIGSKQKKE